MSQYFKCENEVWIEDKLVGNFSNFTLSENRDNIENTAELALPIYTIAKYQDGEITTSREALTRRVRIGIEKDKLITGAKVEVYAWYTGYEKIKVFSGFIRRVRGGFPTILELRDMSFVLQFGDVTKSWGGQKSLTEIMDIILPIANKAFQEYRDEQNLTASWTELTPNIKETVDVSFPLGIWHDVSPYAALSRLVNMYKIYTNVDPEGKVYAGIGIRDAGSPTHVLRTDKNVIGRDIVPTDGLFDRFNVKVTAVGKDGKKLVAQIGDAYGKVRRYKFSPLDTQAGVDNTAELVYNRLKGDRNKGTITLLFYPYVQLFDFCDYTDTLFPELSSGYYVIGRDVTLGENGYRQKLTVTDQSFII